MKRPAWSPQRGEEPAPPRWSPLVAAPKPSVWSPLFTDQKSVQNVFSFHVLTGFSFLNLSKGRPFNARSPVFDAL